MDQSETPTSPEANRSVLGPVLWMETLRLVIAPKLATIVAQHGNNIETRQDLHRRFCEEHNVKPSYSTFSGWCEDLGITFRKRIEVRIPGWKEMPRPDGFVGPMPAQRPVGQAPIVPTILQEEEPEADDPKPVVWDEPLKPSEVFNDNLPNILPGGMRAPAFLNQSDYSN